MKSFKNFLWVVPLIVLIYLYASQGASVLLGSTEHYDLLASLGLSASVTSALTWASVVIDIGTAVWLLVRPSKKLFIFAALWTFVPRIIALIGGVENEIGESLLVFAVAVLSYWCYTKGHYIRLFRK